MFRTYRPNISKDRIGIKNIIFPLFLNISSFLVRNTCSYVPMSTAKMCHKQKITNKINKQVKRAIINIQEGRTNYFIKECRRN